MSGHDILVRAASGCGLMAVVLLLPVASWTLGAAVTGFDVTPLLRSHCHFSTNDIARVSSGRSVARTLDASSDEAAICAAIDMAVPTDFYLERFREIETFKRADGVLQIGRFGPTPSAADMAALTLSDQEINELRTCQPGECPFKLDAGGIERVRAVNLTGPAARPRAEAVIRAHLAEYVARYLREGDAALMTYADEEPPRAIPGDLHRILERSPYLAGTLQPVAEAVGSFTGALPDGVDHFVYWSQESIARRPVLSITHVLIVHPVPGVTVMASKQIYASHFFHASLGLTMLVDQASTGAPPTRVVYLNRSRVDAFDGMLGGVKRSVARSRARAAADRLLQGLATRLQDDYGSASRPAPE
jgi:hypothetical protein